MWGAWEKTDPPPPWRGPGGASPPLRGVPPPRGGTTPPGAGVSGGARVGHERGCATWVARGRARSATFGSRSHSVGWPCSRSNAPHARSTSGGRSRSPAGPFVDVATYGIAASDVWENNKSFDITNTIPAAANNPNFTFRIAAVFEPGTAQYVASEAGYNGDIPTLFDMIIVEGLEVIPEPSSCLMLIIGMVALIRLRLKHQI